MAAVKEALRPARLREVAGAVSPAATPFVAAASGPPHAVLVDDSGHRGFVVRSFILAVALTAVVGLASVPLAIWLRPGSQPLPSARAAGVAFADSNCDGVRNLDELPLGFAKVELVEAERVVAFVRAAADGSFAFDRLPQELLLRVRVSADGSADMSAQVELVDVGRPSLAERARVCLSF